MLTCKQMKTLNMVLSLGAIAYTGYVHYRLSKTNQIIETSIDEVSKDINVSISDAIVENATKIAVEREVNKAVKDISKEVNDTVCRDIRSKVKTSVHESYSDIRESVSKEVAKNVAKLDIEALRSSVKEQAKREVLDKFNENLDSMLQDFNQNLTNVSKIYSSIADNMVKKPQETVFKIGI